MLTALTSLGKSYVEAGEYFKADSTFEIVDSLLDMRFVPAPVMRDHNYSVAATFQNKKQYAYARKYHNRSLAYVSNTSDSAQILLNIAGAFSGDKLQSQADSVFALVSKPGKDAPYKAQYESMSCEMQMQAKMIYDCIDELLKDNLTLEPRNKSIFQFRLFELALEQGEHQKAVAHIELAKQFQQQDTLEYFKGYRAVLDSVRDSLTQVE